ncbi:MAG: group II intron reverse transcriptase/maturase [Acidobacteriaceae bacterium]|nr:group II intron reverse transcriptase/maturase [Acidobacteriaceae bacterium]
MEGRGLAKGNPNQQNALRTLSRVSAPSALARVRQTARQNKDAKFTALMHHIYSVETLRFAYAQIKRQAAPGVDGETWQNYGEALETNLQSLSHRLRHGAYHAKPVRRVYIPKPDGRQRPLGVTALEDKLVQRATVEVLNAIYETDFLGFSYGFRPGRSQHKALDALFSGIRDRRVNWVLDLDVRSFFDKLSHDWLVRFLQHRIADRRVLRLIQKWLSAGVLEDGKRTVMEEGSPQGGSASPLLANIYLHYVFDLWVQAWRQKCAHGDVIVVRYADDIVVGFEFKDEAERFHEELKARMQKFSLELHPDKTRLIEFGRSAAANRKRRGLGRPETFDFLGFTHICGKSNKGGFRIIRQTIRKRLQAKLLEVKRELRRRMHDPIPEVGAWLKSVVGGHMRYYGVPKNRYALAHFRFTVGKYWHHALCRRSQKGRVRWDRMKRLIRRWLPPAHICHSYPPRRLRVTT